MKAQWLTVLSADMPQPAEAHTDGEPVLSTLAAVDNAAHVELADRGIRVADAGKWAAGGDDDHTLLGAAAGHEVVAVVSPAVASHTAYKQAAAAELYHSVVLAGLQLAALQTGLVSEWHNEARHTTDAAVSAAAPADMAVQPAADSEASEHLQRRHHRNVPT